MKEIKWPHFFSQNFLYAEIWPFLVKNIHFWLISKKTGPYLGSYDKNITIKTIFFSSPFTIEENKVTFFYVYYSQTEIWPFFVEKWPFLVISQKNRPYLSFLWNSQKWPFLSKKWPYLVLTGRITKQDHFIFFNF